MTRRRFPVVATLVVLVAVGIMIRLGFWQLDRVKQKEAELAAFGRNLTKAVVPFPQDRFDQSMLFHPAMLDCLNPGKPESRGAGKAGFRLIATCAGGAKVQLGTSKDPKNGVAWQGGVIVGSIGQLPDSRPLIVAAFVHSPRELMLVSGKPVVGLSANPPRSLKEIPNNHFSYAVQWFLFAGVALVIYGLALRKRLRGG